ncbi:hypothetical protein MCEGE10_01902 [Flavobacteriaceae bacterium]
MALTISDLPMDKAIFRTHKTKRPSISIIFYLPQRKEVIAFTIADAIPLQNKFLLQTATATANSFCGISYYYKQSETSQ